MRTVRPRSPVRLRAPAKINLGLEVLGRQTDGFHEVVTILQTVSLFDQIVIEPAERFHFLGSPSVDPATDLALRAIELARSELGIEMIARVQVEKSIPLAAGLGGGSSDAGTILGALSRAAGYPAEHAERAAAQLGSDVPFFVRGGTALATGTGATIEPLPSPPTTWFLIATPELRLPDKTRRLYASLDARDLSDGSATMTQAARLRAGDDLEPALLRNAFSRPLLDFQPVRQLWNQLHAVAPVALLPSGAGPSLVALYAAEAAAREAGERLTHQSPRLQVAVCHSIGPGYNDDASARPARSAPSGAYRRLSREETRP